MLTSVDSDAMICLYHQEINLTEDTTYKHGINLEYLADNSGIQAGVEKWMHSTFSTWNDLLVFIKKKSLSASFFAQFTIKWHDFAVEKFRQ